MATTYIDAATRVAALVLQGRTDVAGVEQVGAHIDGEDLRLINEILSEGIVKPSTGYQVAERGAGANMSVDVGSGTAELDLACVIGTDPGQGRYLVRWPDATTNVTVPAADLSNPRIDELYLVVQDDTYDANGANIVPRLAYRDGTPAGTPVAPGPDAGWDAFLLLASIAVAAGESVIEDADITDERVYAALSLGGSQRVAVASDGDLELRVPASGGVEGFVGGVRVFRADDVTFNLDNKPLVNVDTVNGVDVSAHVDGSAHQHEILGGTTGSPTLGTGDAEELTDIVNIPASWGSWSIAVTVAGVYVIIGTVSNVRLYIRPGSGGDGPFNDFNFTPDGTAMPYTVTLFRSGMVSTGNQTIALRGSKTGAGSVSLPAASMSYVVKRES